MDDGMDYMDEIVAEFVIEAEELLEKLDADLVELEKTPDDLNLINEIFRSAHTIKGTAGFLGFDNMARLTHAAEDILNRMRKGNLAVSAEIMDAILATVDILGTMLDSIRENGKEGDAEVDGLIATLNELNNGGQDQAEQSDDPGQPESDAEKAEEQTQAESGNDSSTGKEPEAKAPDGGEEKKASASKSKKKKKSPSKSAPAEKAEESPAPQPEPAAQAEEKPAAAKAPGNETPAPAAKKSAEKNKENRPAQTVRVPVDRLDHLMNLAGELVLGRNRLNQVCQFFETSMDLLFSDDAGGWSLDSDRQSVHEIFEKNIEQLSEANGLIALISSELQMSVMQTRMMPVGTLFKKVPRMVRDLSREMKKDVEIIIKGEETELDKSVIEELGDPLTHLIRNSMDHGVESPEERKKIGKNPRGRITLFATQEGNDIIIGIEDDGAGLDPDKLKSRAVERGIISESEAKRMNAREAYNLIFAPGFSTKTQVTSVSGRGVGMDVVKTNVSRLNGLIEVESQKGVGTTFYLKLPLTLAIIQGLIVQVAEENFIIPLISVLETIRTSKEKFSWVGDRRVIRLRDSVIPLVDLVDFFDIRRQGEEPEEYYVVIVAIADKRVGLVVDSLVGQEEVVIKSLGDFFESTEAIAGATIMGDGRVRLIIDVSEIVRIEQEKAA